METHVIDVSQEGIAAKPVLTAEQREQLRKEWMARYEVKPMWLDQLIAWLERLWRR